MKKHKRKGKKGIKKKRRRNSYKCEGLDEIDTADTEIDFENDNSRLTLISVDLDESNGVHSKEEVHQWSRLRYWFKLPLAVIGLMVIALEIAAIVCVIIGLSAVFKMKSNTASNIGKSTVKAGLKGCITVSSEAHVNDNPAQYLPDPPYHLKEVCARKRLMQCRKLCKPALCCREDARDNCYDSFPRQCLGYEPCNVLYQLDTNSFTNEEFHDTMQTSYNSAQEGVDSENAQKENNDDFDLTIEHFDTPDPQRDITYEEVNH